MFSYSVATVLVFCTVSIFASKVVEGSQSVLQKTVEALFKERSDVIYPGPCRIIRSSSQQNRMCTRHPVLPKVLSTAKEQAIEACEETFKYDRWNCSLIFNRKAKKSIFNKVYRQTAFIHALMAASLTHAVAKACAAGDMTKCSCPESSRKKSNFQWRGSGCDDDFKFGKRFTRKFLEVKNAGTDQIGEVLKQDVLVGINTVGEQLREVCKCHGVSGSCTTKTCWKKLAPFNSAMGLLKKQYHHAIKRRILNYTTKRAITPKVRKRIKIERTSLVYLQKTPDLCVTTAGRVCKDRGNCATLCCGRGYIVGKKSVKSRCRCKMINCCSVQCDSCIEQVEMFTCK
ncbi:hypothetical protein O0L34_g3893 [Tuta absoluta]|nr:hypothetical protein O0L34_g3893 [Tuta absoluta]